MHFFDLDMVHARAIRNTVPISSTQTLTYIHSLLMTHKPVQCVELGTAIGWGSYHIANSIQQRGGILHTFEVSYPTYHFANQFLYHNNIHNVHSYHADIHSLAVETLLTNPIDFLYIDAHKASYNDYFHQFMPFLAPNATIVFDDITQYAHKIGNLYDILDAAGRLYQQHSTDNQKDHLLVCRRIGSRS